MIPRILQLAAFLIAVTVSPAAAAQPPRTTPADGRPVEVMVVGVFHMANPGQDLMNVQVDDVLAPARQREIQQVTTSLARFRPTKVAVEWAAATVADRWAKHRAGTLPPSRNEVVQLGFRLAQATGSEPIGIDAAGEFPFGPLAAFAQANGQGPLLAEMMSFGQAQVSKEERLLKTGSVATVLRSANDPDEIARNHGAYMRLLAIGKGDQQPAVDLVSQWERRNLRICANLIQAARPGDRVVVLFGSGHSHLLRRCVAETPGLRLVEPLGYLPKSAGRRSR